MDKCDDNHLNNLGPGEPSMQLWELGRRHEHQQRQRDLELEMNTQLEKQREAILERARSLDRSLDRA